jgi:hypothetical protein
MIVCIIEGKNCAKMKVRINVYVYQRVFECSNKRVFECLNVHINVRMKK